MWSTGTWHAAAPRSQTPSEDQTCCLCPGRGPDTLCPRQNRAPSHCIAPSSHALPFLAGEPGAVGQTGSPGQQGASTQGLWE